MEAPGGGGVPPQRKVSVPGVFDTFPKPKQEEQTRANYKWCKQSTENGLCSWNGGNLNRLWWKQEDGTTVHVTDVTMQHLDAQFGARVISRHPSDFQA